MISLSILNPDTLTPTGATTLEHVLGDLDLSSLELELATVENAIRHLKKSNEEIQQFIRDEQVEQQRAASLAPSLSSSSSTATPSEQQERQERYQETFVASEQLAENIQVDPEFTLAIEENEVTIAKYNHICEVIRTTIQQKRQAGGANGSCSSLGPMESSASTIIPPSAGSIPAASVLAATASPATTSVAAAGVILVEPPTSTAHAPAEEDLDEEGIYL